MAMTKSQIEYEKKRMKLCASYTVKYTPKEKKESDRITKYLHDANISANAYIKMLIQHDLDSKGIPYPTIVEDEM